MRVINANELTKAVSRLFIEANNILPEDVVCNIKEAQKSEKHSFAKSILNTFYAELEAELLEKINKLGIGPQGFGGDTTALCVNVEFAPTHIAGLPVAVNVGCHVTRHKNVII